MRKSVEPVCVGLCSVNKQKKRQCWFSSLSGGNTSYTDGEFVITQRGLQNIYFEYLNILYGNIILLTEKLI